MPPLAPKRQQPPLTPAAAGNLGASASESQPSRGRGGLYDSPEREPPAARRGTAPAPAPFHDPSRDRPGTYDPLADGRGGLAGLRDPYDRPARSQLKGAQSRLRQDKATGALDEVAGRYRVLFGAHQAVRKGLRRSIADAYAAYVGQVVKLPEDSYGLALRALDRSFNGTEGLPPGAIDVDRLRTSPFATSRAKHAQIFNTAHKIMRDLGGYVYDVSYYCPGELDQLREMRGPGAAAPAAESYKAGPRLSPGDPPPGREAVGVAPRSASVPPGAARRSGRRPLTAPPPNPSVSPITGATRQWAPAPPEQPAAQRPPSRQRRPVTAGGSSGAAASAAAAAAARSVAATLDTAAEAEAIERDGGGGPELLDPLEDRQRRNLRRRSTPAGFVKTPPHCRVSKYYDHVRPPQEMLEVMRRRAVRAAQAQMEKAAERAAAAAAAAEADSAGAGAAVADAAADAAAAAAAASVQSAAAPAYGSGTGIDNATAHRRPYSRDASPDVYGGGGSDGVGATAAKVRHPAGAGDAPGTGAPEGAHGAGGGQEGLDPAGTARILWIIETAYELGLAEVLGLEGPPPYPRSQRLYPMDHRRQFYEAVYSSPERYAPYAPYAPPIDMKGMLGPTPLGGTTAVRRYDGEAVPRREYDSPALPGGAAWPYEYDGSTAQRLDVAAARRYLREAAGVPEAKLYPRSQRLSPR